MKRFFDIGEIIKFSRETSLQPTAKSMNRLDRFLMKLTDSEKNLFFIHNYLKLILFSLYWLVCLSLPFNYYLFVVYLIVYIYMTTVAMAPFHASSHRNVFKRSYRKLEKFIYYLCSTSLGYPPEYYSVTHIPNHHKENNGKNDLGNTIGYNRASRLSYLQNILSFSLQITGFFGLYKSLKAKSSKSWAKKWLTKLAYGYIFYWSVALLFFVFSWQKGVFYFLIPFILFHIFDRTANWIEHIFISSEIPLESLGNSFIILGKINQKTGNSGYHAIHHLNPGLLEADRHNYFEKHIEEILEKKCLIFYDITYGSILLNAWRKNYQFFYDHLYITKKDFRTKDEIILDVKTRLTRQHDLEAVRKG